MTSLFNLCCAALSSPQFGAIAHVVLGIMFPVVFCLSRRWDFQDGDRIAVR